MSASALLVSVLFACQSGRQVHGEYKVQSTGYTSTVTLFSDSSFVEKRQGIHDNKSYRGRWRYVVTEQQLIETTIESSGSQILTETPKTTYQVKGDSLVIKP